MNEAGAEAVVEAGEGPVEVAPDGWQRLSVRTVLVTALVMGGVVVGAGVPATLALANGRPLWVAVGLVLTGGVLVIACGTAADYVRWRRTRYRIGPERAELHTGLLLVKRRSLARERIRSVDLTANVMLRLLGLVKVRIGTGENTGESTLELDPVTREEGERLRRELLARTAPGEPGAHREGELATLDPRWIRYAPVSFVAPALGGAAVGGLMQVSEWFGAQGKLIRWVGDLFQDTSVVWIVVLLVLGACVAGAVGALGLWVEMWWNYRLEREPGGTLRVRRGLFTTRSISIEERRLRGVELVEPIGVRALGAARVDAVATGLAEDESSRNADHKTLLPAAPRAVAESVAADVLREASSPTSTARLTPHPRAARARRLRWAFGAALPPVLVLVVLGVLLTDVLLYVAGACAVVLWPLAYFLAADAYRSLGHAISGDYLVARSGTVRRTTVALQRSGVIGWTVKQSVFQRRAGLITLTATTAAGAGAYSVYDAGQPDGLQFGADAVPGVLAPFLERG